MTRRLFIVALTFAASTLAFVSGYTFVAATHSNNIIGLLGIDANVQGNTATSLGQIDGCARVEPGAQIDVDYFVDAVPEDRPIVAFEVTILYDASQVEVVGVDHDFLLGAVGNYQPFAAGDELPDNDGSYRFLVMDVASRTGMGDQHEANVERGPGILARLTLRAKARGLSAVTIGYEPLRSGLYPLLQDTMNETIIVDRIGGASIAIGQDCPPEALAPTIFDAPNTEEEIFATPPAAPPAPNDGQDPSTAENAAPPESIPSAPVSDSGSTAVAPVGQQSINASSDVRTSAPIETILADGGFSAETGNDSLHGASGLTFRAGGVRIANSERLEDVPNQGNAELDSARPGDGGPGDAVIPLVIVGLAIGAGIAGIALTRMVITKPE